MMSTKLTLGLIKGRVYHGHNDLGMVVIIHLSMTTFCHSTVWREIFAGQNFRGLAAGKDFAKKISRFDDHKAQSTTTQNFAVKIFVV